jgi:hypothetical protein
MVIFIKKTEQIQPEPRAAKLISLGGNAPCKS